MANTRFDLSDDTCKLAAAYWAQYLPMPGKQDTSVEEVSRHTPSLNQGLTGARLFSVKNLLSSVAPSVTKEQFDTFITILANKIKSSNIDMYNPYEKCLMIGHPSSYEPPQEVVDSLEEANIKIPAFGFFPFKATMRISQDGTISVDKKTVTIDRSLLEYPSSAQLSTSSTSPGKSP